RARRRRAVPGRPDHRVPRRAPGVARRTGTRRVEGMTRAYNNFAKDGYRKGPVLLRRGQVPQSTSDQRLLSPSQDAAWLHADPWRGRRFERESVGGFGALAEGGPAVSVFGSARTKPGTPVYDLGMAVGRGLVEEGYAVITGGGPGVMEAANRGASEAGGLSV